MTLPPGARDVRRVDGGDINEAFRVRLADGADAFVKTRADPAPGEYAAEAAALEWLAQAGALRTPRVLAADERFLALEWITPRPLGETGADELGRGLAATHAAGAPSFGDFGAAPHARFAWICLSNEPAGDWPTFYARRRLEPLATLAHDRGSLSRAGAGAVHSLCDRITELAGPAEPPSRLHGDLWRGNAMGDESGAPVLIDPCSYGGHREVDLAMLRLFGAPSQRTFAAYEEVAPLAEGWRERVELYQLLPLLVHALLFGGSYGEAVERAARRYG